MLRKSKQASCLEVFLETAGHVAVPLCADNSGSMSGSRTFLLSRQVIGSAVRLLGVGQHAYGFPGGGQLLWSLMWSLTRCSLYLPRLILPLCRRARSY